MHIFWINMTNQVVKESFLKKKLKKKKVMKESSISFTTITVVSI